MAELIVSHNDAKLVTRLMRLAAEHAPKELLAEARRFRGRDLADDIDLILRDDMPFNIRVRDPRE